MNAKSVNDLFDQAWAEYENLTKEVDAFCGENDIGIGLLKVEMGGPHVHIKHSLPPKLWTEELHDKLCETFGVYLTYFKVAHWKGVHNKPHYVDYYWNYAPEPHSENFILDYNEVLNGDGENEYCGGKLLKERKENCKEWIVNHR